VKSTQNKTIEEGAIIRQVEKICRSNEFRSKRLLCEFLSYVVSEDLAGRGSEIKGYSIGVDVFGKDVDFDPGEDALVRIHAGRLRRMLEVYYLKSGRNDPIRIEIPKGNYTPVFTDNLAVVASEEKPGLPDLTKQKPVSSSLVILPFQNLTGNPDHDYFALGFCEELSVEFSKFEDLIIYSCSTCRIYKEDFSELRHNFCEKGIRFVIEGSVMQADDQLKVVVKLVDIFENRQLWAERYVKQLTLDNLNDIQENIAKEISRVVGGEYGLILQKLSAEANRARPQNLDT
jgi:TolB-like protein